MSEPKVFIDDDGSYWVPVAAAKYLEARRAAHSLAQECLGSDFEGLKYNGRKTVWLTDHEAGCTCEAEGCNLREELCWEFFA
jgi:hypothetical protein